VDRDHHVPQRLADHLAGAEEILGIVEATDEQKAKPSPRALIASRTNLLLSLPMFYTMVSANLG
jgi:uncharacterized membrane protein